MKEVVSEIFKGIDEKLVSEEVKTKVGEMINTVVESKVAEKAAEISASTRKLAEENVSLKAKIDQMISEMAEKEKYLQEAARDLGKKLAQEVAEKEAILAETAAEYRTEVENILKETASTYRESLEKEALDVAEEYKTFMESVVLQEASEFKKLHEAASAEKLESFKADLVEKADQYMMAELQKSIPAKIMEAAAEASALKPIVEGVIALVETHGIKVDKTGLEALKKAKDENAKLSESFNAKLSDNVKLNARVKELEKSVKITQLTEGMTQAQKQKASKLLESYSVNELDSKFKAIKDIIVNESIKPVAKVQSKEQASAVVDTAEMDQYVKSLDRMRRA
jgi:hypothetical protein